MLKEWACWLVPLFSEPCGLPGLKGNIFSIFCSISIFLPAVRNDLTTPNYPHDLITLAARFGPKCLEASNVSLVLLSLSSNHERKAELKRP